MTKTAANGLIQSWFSCIRIQPILLGRLLVNQAVHMPKDLLWLCL